MQLGPDPEGCREEGRGKWFQAPTYPLSIRGNDWDIGPI